MGVLALLSPSVAEEEFFSSSMYNITIAFDNHGFSKGKRKKK
jgi:hypothetical protein